MGRSLKNPATIASLYIALAYDEPRADTVRSTSPQGSASRPEGRGGALR
jgi:hypothetical protein